MVIFKSITTNSCICNSISFNIKKYTRKLCYLLVLWINSLDVFFYSNFKIIFCNDFVISTIIIIAFVIFGGLGITKYIVFYPIILLAQYLFVLAISFVLSCITVYFRDLQHLIGVALQLLFYATPIVYATDTIPEGFKWILNINPMTYVINGYRDVFYNQVTPNIYSLLILIITSIILCVIGYLIFNKLQKGFAEQL